MINNSFNEALDAENERRKALNMFADDVSFNGTSTNMLIQLAGDFGIIIPPNLKKSSINNDSNVELRDFIRQEAKRILKEEGLK